jgi:hypothetical protein
VDGVVEHGIVGGEVDEKRGKDIEGDQRTICHQANGNRTENRIYKKYLLADWQGGKSPQLQS